jgi:serine/threonine protein kinase
MRVASARVMSEAVADSTSLVGQCFAERYELEARIGTGAAGDTYRARHMEQSHKVVVKLFHDDVTHDAARQRRFELETSKQAGLAHPNLPATLAFGVHAGRRFVVREWLEGETLAERLARGPLSLDEAMAIARQLLAALAAAHATGLVHRHVHPGNVFLEARKHGGDRVKLLDFAPEARAAKQATPYRAPEDGAGELSARSDVFSVGAVVAAMLQPASRVMSAAADDRPARPPSESTTAQGALASAAVVAVLSTTAPGAAAARVAVPAEQAPAFQPAEARAPVVVSAFETAFAPPVVASPAPPPAPAAHPDNPLLRWIGRATSADRFDRFEDAADMLSELVDRLPRELRVAATDSPKNRRAPIPLEPAPAPAAEMSSTGAHVADFEEVTSQFSLPKQHAPRSTPELSATPAPPATAAEPLLEVAPVALHGPGEPGVSQLTAATAIGAFAFAAVVILVMPGELGRARRSGDTPRTLAAGPAAAPAASPAPPASPTSPLIDARSKPRTKSAPLAPIPLSAIAPIAPMPVSTPQPKPTLLAPIAKPKPVNATRDPWADPIPKELQRYRASALSGAPGDKAAIEALRRYNREHARDARGYLITARFYLNRLWRSDAVAQYAAAIERDASVRGAPEILPALLECVAEGKAAPAAEALIQKVYGTGAQPAIDRALDKARSQDVAIRLSTLSEKLLTKAP